MGRQGRAGDARKVPIIGAGPLRKYKNTKFIWELIKTPGYPHIKVTGMLVGKFKLNPQGRPMWVWLKLKLTPKGDFWLVSVGAFLVNFFMHSTNSK